MSANKPILLLQMQRMGDLILSYPLMIWLARQYPGHPLFVAAEENFFRPLMKLTPRATYFPWSQTSALKQHDYALVINLSIQEKAAILAHEISAESKLGPVQRPDGTRYIHGDWQLYRTSLVKNNLYNRYHWADLNGLDAIAYNDMAATRFDVPRTLPSGATKVGIFIGASEAAKRPTPRFLSQLILALLNRGLRPILFGGPREIELGHEVERQTKASILNLVGKLRLDELSAVGQTLALFITPDTGPMHLAAWTGLKCLNLSLGNVNPWETGPYQPGHYVLRADMDCAKGCWHCTRSRLYCHDPFDPKRIAALASRIVASETPEKLGRMRLPGLTFSTTGKQHGVYHLSPLGETPFDDEYHTARFWQTFFGSRFGITEDTTAQTAWEALTANAPDSAEAIISHMPEISRQFTHGVRTGSLLDENFWTNSPPPVRPLTGYVHMALENGDYKRPAWLAAMTHLEALIGYCHS